VEVNFVHQRVLLITHVCSPSLLPSFPPLPPSSSPPSSPVRPSSTLSPSTASSTTVTPCRISRRNVRVGREGGKERGNSVVARTLYMISKEEAYTLASLALTPPSSPSSLSPSQPSASTTRPSKCFTVKTSPPTSYVTPPARTSTAPTSTMSTPASTIILTTSVRPSLPPSFPPSFPVSSFFLRVDRINYAFNFLSFSPSI